MNLAYAVKLPLEASLEKPALKGAMSLLNPKNWPGGTFGFTKGASAMKKLSALAETEGVPEAVKAGILEVLQELTQNQS